MDLLLHRDEFFNQGFTIYPNAFSATEIASIEGIIDDHSPVTVRSQEIFAIRELLRWQPDLKKHLLTTSIIQVIEDLGGKDNFLTKAIYFDKPANSNWFVAYHRDLSVNVTGKHEVEGYSRWTNKRGQLGVIPPFKILESTITLRIHLDQTNKDNGALRVIPGSHKWRLDRGITESDKEVICNANAGDVMVMSPLLLHASRRSAGKNNRRIIHLEFCNIEHSPPIRWKEKLEL